MQERSPLLYTHLEVQMKFAADHMDKELSGQMKQTLSCLATMSSNMLEERRWHGAGSIVLWGCFAAGG